MKMLGSLIAFLLSMTMTSAEAIEYGSTAENNSIVVHIELTFSNYNTSCSGALIAPRIIVTADHCIKLVGESNKNNLIQSAKVAPAGLKRGSQDTSYVRVIDFFLTKREGKNGAAFLVLESPLKIAMPVRIASEQEIDDIQEKRSLVKFAGYGITNKYEVKFDDFPQIAEGELYKDLSNSHVHFRSNPAAPCGGDSGGPVYQQLDGEILLIGVINGPWYLEKNSYCSHENIRPEGVQQEKLFRYSVYIPLYTFDAISDAKKAAEKVLITPSMPDDPKNSIQKTANTEYKTAKLEYVKIMAKIFTLKQRYVNNSQLLSIEERMRSLPIDGQFDLSVAIREMDFIKKQIDSSIKSWDDIYKRKISCTFGNRIKIVIAQNPKCPKGYNKVS